MVLLLLFLFSIAYAITEEAQHNRELEGPSTSIPLSEMISSALPPEKKDKLTDVLNNVSNCVVIVDFRIALFHSLEQISHWISHLRRLSRVIFLLISFRSLRILHIEHRHYKMEAVKVANQLVLQA